MRKSTRVLIDVFAYAAAFVVLFPVIGSFLISLMTDSEIFSNPPKFIPNSLYFGNYAYVMKTFPILTFYGNTLIVSFSTTILQIVTASLAAYAFVFMEFKGKKLLFSLVLLTAMIPFEATIISNYIGIAKLRLLDTYTALILPYAASAYSVFIIRQFYMTVPKELKEAAMIDGCSNLRFLVKILAPLSKLVVSSLFIYLFVQSWNYFLWPLLVTNSNHKRTVQIGLSMLKSVEDRTLGPMMAGVMMVALPTLAIFAIGQKYLIEGLFAGSVKG